MAPPANAYALPLSARIQQLVRTLQFLWFGAHLALFILTVRYALFYIRFAAATKPAVFTYRAAFFAAIVAYGVVVYRSHLAKKTMTRESLPRIAMDENVQYLRKRKFWRAY